MSVTREEVFRSAMALPEDERLLLASELLQTVSNELPGVAFDDPDLLAILESRANDGSAGIPWEKVRAQLQSDLEA